MARAGFAKGMATTSGWTLVLCDCRSRIKSANDESLARDEGGGHNLFMEVATHKTIQGRRLRMTQTIFFRLWMQLCAEPPSSEGHGGVYDDRAA